MRLEKRMKIELRDITEKKREAITELSDLRTEVALLREERDAIKKEKNQLVSDIHTAQKDLDDKVQYARLELLRIEKQKSELLDSVSRLQIEQTETEQSIVTLGKRVQSLIVDEYRAQKECDVATGRLLVQTNKNEEIEQTLAHSQKALADTQSDTHKATQTLTQLKFEIAQEVEKLNHILKEQERNSNWVEYLDAKESFLAEQFPLLGVKFVRYNSK